MRNTRTIKSLLLSTAFAMLATGCAPSEEEGTIDQSDNAAKSVVTVTIAPGPDVQMELQEALIEVEPGTVIQLEEGTYHFVLGLSLDVDNVTLRGRGMYKTVLDFKNQEAGSEGLHVTSRNVTLEDFAVIDTKGNAIKSHNADNIVYRNVRAEWTGGPKSMNGAYGLYPVSSRNVLIEGCVAIAASDAGIYVGQSENVMVRDSRVEFNVAGIEIENCHGAEVRGNVATNNTGGILVFDLPDLPVQHGRDIRILDNKVYANNTQNFAPEGNIVATVPTGTGIMVMANTNVEIFDNEIHDNDTANVLIVSYLANGIEVKDPNYYPYPERIHIHDNVFGPGGENPGGSAGMLIAMLLGKPLPDIVWDGIVNPEKVVDGEIAEDARICVHDNTKTEGELTFANLGGLETLSNPANANIVRDLASVAGTLPPVQAVTIRQGD